MATSHFHIAPAACAKVAPLNPRRRSSDADADVIAALTIDCDRQALFLLEDDRGTEMVLPDRRPAWAQAVALPPLQRGPLEPEDPLSPALAVGIGLAGGGLLWLIVLSVWTAVLAAPMMNDPPKPQCTTTVGPEPQMINTLPGPDPGC